MQSSFFDLLLFESEDLPGVPVDDVAEFLDYVAAMEHGLRRLKEDFPSPFGCSAKCMASCCVEAEARTKYPASFTPVKIGLEDRDPAMLSMCRRRQIA